MENKKYILIFSAPAEFILDSFREGEKAHYRVMGTSSIS